MQRRAILERRLLAKLIPVYRIIEYSRALQILGKGLSTGARRRISCQLSRRPVLIVDHTFPECTVELLGQVRAKQQ